MPSLFVYGDAALDIRLQTDDFPQLGGDVEVSSLDFLPGGSASNCAVVAARLGATVNLIGITGTDARAQVLIDDLAQHGIDLTYLRQVNGAPGVILAVIGAHGERTFFSYRGVNATCTYGELPPTLFGHGDILHISGYTFQTAHSRATAYALIERARAQSDCHISLDPSYLSARDWKDPDLFATLDFCFPNREEAYLMTGERDPERAAEQLRAAGVKTVAIKLGDQGCYVTSAHGSAHLPAYTADQVVDTIGAGDAFCGGFLCAILAGEGEQDAARLGMAAAAYVIAVAGGHAGAPTREQALRLMDAHS
ncbi:MAG: carbohydrate kinase family protein [Anaerolineae bacterium]|nr:carbohydrate kinase family protein [Anaerolineae bacterium]